MLAKLVGVALLLFVIVIMAAAGTYVVNPGYRGVEVTMGKVSDAFKPEGFGLKQPFVTTIYPVSIRQQTAEDSAECYSSDLQQIQVELRVLYRIPESSVVKLFHEYYGDPFDSLIAPRIQEALKEVAALQSAEQIVKNREQIKTRALELESAIEAKMVQEQDAAKAKYIQQRAQIDADTAVIQARGEAESIRIRGQALKDDPAFVDLKIVDKWDGFTPLVIGGGGVVYQPQELEHLRQLQQNSPSAPSSRPGANPR